MGATLLEVTRSLHEDLERFQQAIIEEIEYPPRNIKENIFQAHRVSTYLDKAQETADRLGNIYEDRDGARRDEIASMAGIGPQLFSMFYDKLKEVKDYHRRFPDASIDYPEDHIYIVDDEDTARLFSGDEYYGKALDLHYFYDVFINLKNAQKIDYITYLNSFYKFNDDLARKGDKDYAQYLKELAEYLGQFLKKAQPLEENDKILKEIEEDFERKWALGEFTGWDAIYPPVKQEVLVPIKQEGEKKKEEKRDDDRRRDRDDRDRRDRDDRRHRDDDRRHDDRDRKRDRDGEKRKDKKKEVPLEENPLYCRACRKLFAKDTVFNNHLVGKKHLAAVKKIEAEATVSAPENRVQFKDVYASEWKVHELCVKHYQEQLLNSKINIEKKQSKTAKELELEFEEEEPADQELDEIIQEPEIKLTKDNYPVGWDGKPIPYWLYKLHGLGVEYKCEICGNASYMGRKAYEKHFQEWRHAHGMRCLGIPNTRHFLDITKINDAVALWQKLRRDTTEKIWRPEVEEEYEDQEGNVYNKKTYEDLKRQGLIK